MKNKCWQVFRDHTWTVLAFPKQDRTMLWNDNTKTYQFYKGIPYKQYEVEQVHNGKTVKVKKAVIVKDNWKMACICLSCLLATTIGLLAGMLLVVFK